jgi:NAD(P)-dependent dehydrogenase (short-subunit alcohol dehydrogenase family)
MSKDGILSGRSAVVAGGSRGIGRAVALALADAGAAVVVNGRAAEPAREVVDAITQRGGRALSFAGSVADFDVAAALVDACIDAFGGVDVLVNCVGIEEPPGSSILDLDAEAWRTLIDAHLTSTFNTCRHAAPHMVERGRGAIVNTSSHSYLGHYGGTGYPAGKGGTNSLTFAMAAELRNRGVHVNAVCPGARTRLSTSPGAIERIERLHERGILSDAIRDASLAPPDPEDIGPLYVYLASDLAVDVSGRVFSASGGYIGLHALGSETLVGFRNVAGDGPWPLDEIDAKLRAALRAEAGGG